MEQRVLARGAAGAAAVVAVLAAFGQAGPLPGAERAARADDAKQAAATVTGPVCVLKGSYPVPKGTQVYDASSGGRVIANFTGTYSPLQLSQLPADPTTGRARISTTTGQGSFRIDGYVSPASIPVFTTRDISVTGGHIWISSAQRVKLVQASNSGLTAELTVLGTNGQTVKATAPCDAFTLQPGTPTAMDVPGNGRGYLTKSSNIDFFDEANGNAIFTLKMVEGAQHLFWSTESKAGFVHVQARADLTLDVWVRLRDLEPLKKGEMMDQLIPPVTQVQGAQLALDKAPKVVQATKEIPIRARRDAKEAAIGAIEVGAEVYVMETITGWASVLPKNLGVMPPEDGGFWIPAGEVAK